MRLNIRSKLVDSPKYNKRQTTQSLKKAFLRFQISYGEYLSTLRIAKCNINTLIPNDIEVFTPITEFRQMLNGVKCGIKVISNPNEDIVTVVELFIDDYSTTILLDLEGIEINDKMKVEQMNYITELFSSAYHHLSQMDLNNTINNICDSTFLSSELERQRFKNENKKLEIPFIIDSGEILKSANKNLYKNIKEEIYLLPKIIKELEKLEFNSIHNDKLISNIKILARKNVYNIIILRQNKGEIFSIKVLINGVNAIDIIYGKNTLIKMNVQEKEIKKKLLLAIKSVGFRLDRARMITKREAVI